MVSNFFYFFKGIKSAFVYAGAFEGGLVPGVGGLQVRVPEGPGSALIGTAGIDGTLFSAVKKYTVIIFLFFDECSSKAYLLSVAIL